MKGIALGIGVSAVLLRCFAAGYFHVQNQKGLKAKQAFTEEAQREFKETPIFPEAFQLPRQLKIFGPGEYRHGNQKTQKMRKALAEKLNARGDFKAMVLEMPYVDGLRANAFIHGKTEEDRSVKTFSLKDRSDLGKACGKVQGDFILPLKDLPKSSETFFNQEHAVLSVGATFGSLMKILARGHYQFINPSETFVYYFQEDEPYVFTEKAFFSN